MQSNRQPEYISNDFLSAGFAFQSSPKQMEFPNNVLHHISNTRSSLPNCQNEENVSEKDILSLLRQNRRHFPRNFLVQFNLVARRYSTFQL